MSAPGSTTAARSGAPVPPPRRDGSRRLRTVGAALIAMLAVAAGILLVNLLHSPPDSNSTAGRASTPAPAGPRTPATAGTSTHPATPASTRPASTTPASATTRPAAGTTGVGPVAPVVILNDSRIKGLADAARDPVEKAGFTVDRVGGYVSTYNVPVTTVFYEDSLKAAAQNLQQRVPGISKIEPIAGTDIKLYEPGKLILVVTRAFPTAAP